MMTTLCFNSVPMDLVADSTGDSRLTPQVHFKLYSNHFLFKPLYFLLIYPLTLILACFQERVTILIEQLRQFGVPEKLLFSPEDLLEKKNIPKVARCLANCVELVI